MSELTIILNQILDFTASKNSEIPNLFNLGLSISTIEKIAEVLPFKLTNEIIELYTWRDGTSNLTDVMANLTFHGIFERLIRMAFQPKGTNGFKVVKRKKKEARKMMNWWDKNFASCELGDERLSNRAYAIGKKLSEGFGKALSEIFKSGSELKRAYEFSPITKQNLARS